MDFREHKEKEGDKLEAIVVVQTKEDGELGLDGSGNAGQKWLEVE